MYFLFQIYNSRKSHENIESLNITQKVNIKSFGVKYLLVKLLEMSLTPIAHTSNNWALPI